MLFLARMLLLVTAMMRVYGARASVEDEMAEVCERARR